MKISSLLQNSPEDAVGSTPMAFIQAPSGSQKHPLQDTASLSRWGEALSRSGLDLENSTLSRSQEQFSFQLDYSSEKFTSLSAQGLYARSSRELNLSFSYSFQQEVMVDGKSYMKSFEANFSFTARHVEETSISPYSKKEDIMDLVNRMLESIRDISKDDDKKLIGVLLDKEDVRDLAAVEDGKLLKEIESLVRMVILHSRMMEFMKGESEGDGGVLYPKRQVEEGIDMEHQEMSIENFQMEIKETGMIEIPKKSGEAENNEDVHSPVSWVA